MTPLSSSNTSRLSRVPIPVLPVLPALTCCSTSGHTWVLAVGQGTHPAPDSAMQWVPGVTGVHPPAPRHLGSVGLSVTEKGRGTPMREGGCCHTQPANALGEVKTLGPVALAAPAMPRGLRPSPSLTGCRASQHQADPQPRSSGPLGTADRPVVPPDDQDRQPQRQAAPRGQEGGSGLASPRCRGAMSTSPPPQESCSARRWR